MMQIQPAVKIIKRHETELKWIKLMQTPYLLGFNDNIYHESNISKIPDFDVFSLLEFRKRTTRYKKLSKMVIVNAKVVFKRHLIVLLEI